MSIRRTVFALSVAIVAAFVGFALSFPIARHAADAYARSIVRDHPAGSPVDPAVEQMIGDLHGHWDGYSKVCAGPSCVTGGLLHMYAGGIVGLCSSEARLIMVGNATGIKGWTYGYLTMCGHHRFRQTAL